MNNSVASDFPSSSRKPLLEVRAVNLWRGEQHLLRNLSFEINGGELLQVVGPNGIGKSSLLRVIAGLLPAESGEVYWQGENVSRRRTEFCSALAYLGHLNALKNDLTAFENLAFAIGIRRRIDNKTCLARLDALGVAHCAALPVRVLSAGQRRRVAMACVSLMAAQLWVLDEPVTNLDAAGAKTVEGLMAEHLAQGGAIIAAAHQSLLATHTHMRSLALH